MWWIAHGQTDVPHGHDWLSAGERAQLDAIRFTKRHDEFRTRRWTAKRALAAMLRLDDDAGALTTIEVGHEIGGAPYVRIDGSRRQDVEVSLSDRAGWAVCLARQAAGDTASASLGIDLEIVEPRSDAFVDDFFTPAERAHVRSLAPGEPQDAAANLIWSAKEAALKVLKVGLRADTRDVEIRYACERLPGGWHMLEAHLRDGPTLPGWWRRDGIFVLTLAATMPIEPPRLLPGGSDLAAATPIESWLDRPLVAR